jgi:hypothetical protein
MNTEEMRKIIASTKVGDTLHVKPASGRTTSYTVRKIRGRKARRLSLDGRRGAMRVLFDDGVKLWIRDASGGSALLRVTSVRASVQQEAELEQLEGPSSKAELAVLSAAILPPGYDTMTLDSPAGFSRYVAVRDEPSRPVVSPCTRNHAVEAVVDAWSDWVAKKDALASERWQCIVAHAQAEERMLLKLPAGYTIEPGDPGFYRAALDGALGKPLASAEWVGAIRTSAGEAVVDAWTHAKGVLEGALSRHRTTAIALDIARGDASRCRRALRQIREISKGIEPSGKELAGGEMPEQVATEVGHALRVESKARALGSDSMMTGGPGTVSWLLEKYPFLARSAGFESAEE